MWDCLTWRVDLHHIIQGNSLVATWCPYVLLSISLFSTLYHSLFHCTQVGADKASEETEFRLEPQLLGVIAPQAGYFPYEANALGDYPYLEAMEDFKEKQIGLSRDQVFTLQHVIFPGRGCLWRSARLQLQGQWRPLKEAVRVCMCGFV